AVSKGVEPWAIQQAAAAGIRDFGENRVQEAQAKRPKVSQLVEQATWHLVGHLQKNKVKPALGLFDIIHSVDSLHLAEAISRRATKSVPIFLEVNVAREATKFGLSTDELDREAEATSLLPNLDVRGLMAVAPQGANPEDARPYFRRLREAAERLGLREL